MYLAAPTNCPQGPNGEKRKLSAADAVSSTVGMYVSNAEGTGFKEVCVSMINHSCSCLVDSQGWWLSVFDSTVLNLFCQGLDSGKLSQYGNYHRYIVADKARVERL